MSKLVKEMAGWMQPGLILRSSTSASIRLSWWQSYIVAISCGNNIRVEGLDVTPDNPTGLRRWVLINGQI